VPTRMFMPHIISIAEHKTKHCGCVLFSLLTGMLNGALITVLLTIPVGRECFALLRSRRSPHETLAIRFAAGDSRL